MGSAQTRGLTFLLPASYFLSLFISPARRCAGHSYIMRSPYSFTSVAGLRARL